MTQAKQVNTFTIGLLSDTDKKVLLGIAIVGVGLLGYMKVSSMIKDKKEAEFSIAASTHGSPESYVAKFKEAFDYFGFAGNTDKGLAIATLQSIPTKALWQAVQQSFKSRYDKNLYDELREEFGDSSFGGSMRDVESIIAKMK